MLGNFVIYRELNRPSHPGEKKRAIKGKRTSLPSEPYLGSNSNANKRVEVAAPLIPPSRKPNGNAGPEASDTDQDRELDRSLVGSLIDSYGFRPDALVKKQ